MFVSVDHEFDKFRLFVCISLIVYNPNSRVNSINLNDESKRVRSSEMISHDFRKASISIESNFPRKETNNWENRRIKIRTKRGL